MVLISSQTQSSPFPSPFFSEASVATSSAVLGVQTQYRECTIENFLPDPDCTPGAIFSSATKEDICTSGYSAKVRNVSVKTKKEIYAEYGIAYPPQEKYEVDHLISLELGGSNDISNLWPQVASGQLNSHQKDKVENYLHKQICNGSMSVSEAQFLMAQNWVKIYEALSPAN
jgi:hypothetical protein